MEPLFYLFIVIVSQICLTLLKRWRPRSYHLFTLIAIWIIPLGLSITSFNIVNIDFLIWLVFSCRTFLVINLSLEKPIQGTTSILVYKWFLLSHKISFFIGIFGFITMMSTFLGLNLMFGLVVGLACVFYSLYYGIISRDFAEICTEKMAANIGYYKSEGIPERHLEKEICAVCGLKLLVSVDQEGVLEDTFRLSCGHEFHKFCIRGWSTVGNKQTCPYCHEKLDLKRMFPKPWEKPQLMYGKLLTLVRWFICQPIINLLFVGTFFVIVLSIVLLCEGPNACPQLDRAFGVSKRLSEW